MKIRLLILFFLFVQFIETMQGISWFKRYLDNFHTVEKGKLYRSKQLSARKLKKYLKKYGIKSVINLRGMNRYAPWWQREFKATDECGVKLYNIPMFAQTITNKENLLKLLNIYKTAPKPILIHCKSGTDRTGEAAALWLLEEKKTSKKQALKQLRLKYGYIKRRRPAKRFLIKKWQGYNWLKNSYNSFNYPEFH